MGKPITDAHDIELRAVISTFRWYGQLADKLTDESLPHTHDALALVDPRARRRRRREARALEPPADPGGLEGRPRTGPQAAPSYSSRPRTRSLSRSSWAASLLEATASRRASSTSSNGTGPVTGRALGALHPDVDVLAFTGSLPPSAATSCTTPPTPTSAGLAFPNSAASHRHHRFPTPPTWRRPLRHRSPGASSSTRARCAPRPPASSCTPPSPNRSPKPPWPAPAPLRVGDPSTRPPRWAPLAGESHLARVLDFPHVRAGGD